MFFLNFIYISLYIINFEIIIASKKTNKINKQKLLDANYKNYKFDK
jgi:hypothetical protein